MKRYLLIVCLLGYATAQEPQAPPQDLPSLLPAETLFMLEGDDLGGRERWRKDTAMGRIFSEPEVQHFLRRLTESLAPALNLANGPLGLVGLTGKDLDGIRIRRWGFALVDARYDADLMVDAVLTLEFRKGEDKAKKVVQALRNGAEGFLGATFKEIELRERKVWHAQVLGHELFVMLHGRRLVATTLRDRMDQMLQALATGNPKPLRTAPRFGKTLKRMGADRYACFAYADLPQIYARATAAAGKVVRADILEEIDAAWKKLGLDAVESLAFADIPDGTGFRTEFAITLKERRGVFSILPQGKPSHRFARHAPQDAWIYGGERTDLEAFWNGVLGLVGSFDANARAEIEGGERELGAMLGVDLRKDVLAALGDDWGGYLAPPPGGGLIPDYALFVTVRDRARLEKALDTIAARIVPLAAAEGVVVRPKETQFRDVRIRFLEMAEKRGDPIPIAVAWAFVDDFLVLAPVPQTIKHALSKKPPLAGKEDFQALLRRVPATAQSATYVDTKRLVGWLYNTGVPILQALQGAINEELRPFGGIQLNFQDLPPASVITRHLEGAMFYSAVEDDCVRFGFVSPFGGPLLIVPVAAVAGLSVALVYEGKREVRRLRARQEARDVRARATGADTQRLRTENEMLRKRLEAIEKQIAELRELMQKEDRR